jgi:hypothetical protein
MSETIFYVILCHEDFCFIVCLSKCMDNPQEQMAKLIDGPFWSRLDCGFVHQRDGRSVSQAQSEGQRKIVLNYNTLF